MSKFFDESSSSSSESESDNEIEIKPARKPQMQMMYDSDEEEKKTRIVLPEKAKRFVFSFLIAFYFLSNFLIFKII